MDRQNKRDEKHRGNGWRKSRGYGTDAGLMRMEPKIEQEAGEETMSWHMKQEPKVNHREERLTMPVKWRKMQMDGHRGGRKRQRGANWSESQETATEAGGALMEQVAEARAGRREGHRANS